MFLHEALEGVLEGFEDRDVKWLDEVSRIRSQEDKDDLELHCFC